MIFESYRVDMVSRGIKPHSLLTYDRVTRLFAEWLAANDLTAMTARPGHVQSFLQQTGWNPRTQRTALSYIRAAYAYSVDMLELLERNPCRKVRLQRPEQKVARTIPNRVLRELRAEASHKDDLTLALFMWTGLRTVEVRRLRWEDVSLDRNALLVNGKGAKQRLVPIHPELRKLLVRAQFEPFHHVCPGRGGNSVTASGLHYRMKRISGGRDIQNHDYRRTVATSLRANRVDPYVRDAILGWSKDEMFAMHYSHVSLEEMQEGILSLYSNDPV